MIKINRNRLFLPLLLAFTIIIIGSMSCKIFKNDQVAAKYTIDPVCGMKVKELNAYTFKYHETEYYFDSKDCREVFKMNPERFIKK